MKQPSSDDVHVQGIVLLVVISENANDNRKCCRDDDGFAAEEQRLRNEPEDERRNGWLGVPLPLNHLSSCFEYSIFFIA